MFAEDAAALAAFSCRLTSVKNPCCLGALLLLELALPLEDGSFTELGSYAHPSEASFSKQASLAQFVSKPA